ncbi:MAG: ISL3 family transposase [Eubacteriales bacterium]|nr:ISL3 family transposase [Eubacteriales bacterium]
MSARHRPFLIDQLRNVSSIKSASKHCNISQTTAARIFDKVSYPKTKLPEVLSIDEFKGNAGGEKFQCILTDPKHRKVLDILPRRRLDDLCQYFSQYNNRKDVKYVVMDMSSLFKSMAKACFPKARIVADRYHVVRQVTWAFEAVRKAEQKKFSKDRRLHFKRSRQILLKHSRKLADDEKDQISVMLTASERLRNAYLVKLQFEKVMECKDSATARKELSKWIVFTQSYQLPEFEACCTAFINWSKEILESFDCPYTNGYTEGCNNKIKVIKRNGYGIRNFDRFRNRILHIMAS